MRFELLLALLPLVLGAPIVTPRAGTVIPGKYIVKFKDAEITTTVENALNLLEKAPAHVYGMGKFKGFAAEMSEDILKLVQALPSVRSLPVLIFQG